MIPLSMGTEILAQGLIGSSTACIPNTPFASPSLVAPSITLVLGASDISVYSTHSTNKLNCNLEIVVDHFNLREHVLVSLFLSTAVKFISMYADLGKNKIKLID